MVFYENVAAVKAAYLAKALATKVPVQGVMLNGVLQEHSPSAKGFMHAEKSPTAITAKVLNKDIRNGKVRDEAPIQLVSGVPDGFLGGATNVYAFTTPGLAENNLKPTSITSGGLLKNWSTCVFPAKHNFAIKSETLTVNYYKSSVDGKMYTENDLPDQNEAKCLERYTAEVKAERDARIADTDDLAKLDDMTIKVSANAQRRALTDDERTALTTYRQALRDLPETEGFPFVSMPAIPEALSLYLTEKINQRNQMGGLS